MERGADWEFEALRKRRTEMERRRELADRLVYGGALLGVGALLLLLSVPTEACVHGGGIAGAMCTSIEWPAAVRAGLVVAGVALVLGGGWLSWRALGEQPRHPRLASGRQ